MSISQNQKIKNSQPHIKVNGPYENKECCSFYLLGWMEIDLLHSGFSIFHFTFNNILSLNKGLHRRNPIFKSNVFEHWL